MEQVRALVAQAQRIAVLTGAGISTDSGIPDYRGPHGVWTRDPQAQRQVTLQHYLTDPEVRRNAWRGRREHPAWAARPNRGHDALVELERSGRLLALITQNVDGLHQRAGSAPELVLELHGTIWHVECVGCRARTPMREELDRVTDADPDPACRRCGGILKSATISFGQSLDPVVLRAAVAAAERCDLFLAVGSSLTVQPAAGLCRVAVRGGARLGIVNAQPTAYDELAERSGGAVLREPIGQVLPALVGAALAS